MIAVLSYIIRAHLSPFKWKLDEGTAAECFKRRLVFWIRSLLKLPDASPRMTAARNSWNRSSTTNFIAPIPHQRLFMAFLKSISKNDTLRPIMSAIGSPTYELPKFLTNILSPLQNNKYTVQNSASFVGKIRTLSVDPDEILVSFDVVSLFTCIPTHLATKVVKERLDSDQSLPERTNLSIQNIMALLQFDFWKTYVVSGQQVVIPTANYPMQSPSTSLGIPISYQPPRSKTTAPSDHGNFERPTFKAEFSDDDSFNYESWVNNQIQKSQEIQNDSLSQDSDETIDSDETFDPEIEVQQLMDSESEEEEHA
ncbi:hypothetical protein ACROYT_G015619 [Oculina patagonica]